MGKKNHKTYNTVQNVVLLCVEARLTASDKTWGELERVSYFLCLWCWPQLSQRVRLLPWYECMFFKDDLMWLKILTLEYKLERKFTCHLIWKIMNGIRLYCIWLSSHWSFGNFVTGIVSLQHPSCPESVDAYWHVTFTHRHYTLLYALF